MAFPRPIPFFSLSARVVGFLIQAFTQSAAIPNSMKIAPLLLHRGVGLSFLYPRTAQPEPTQLNRAPAREELLPRKGLDLEASLGEKLSPLKKVDKESPFSSVFLLTSFLLLIGCAIR